MIKMIDIDDFITDYDENNPNRLLIWESEVDKLFEEVANALSVKLLQVPVDNSSDWSRMNKHLQYYEDFNDSNNMTKIRIAQEWF